MMVKKVILLLVMCAYSIARGHARKNPSMIKNVLVVQMAKLGDMVCTTPMFRAVKEKYPSAIVTVLGNSLNKDVVAHNTDVDEYIIFTGFKEAIFRLKREHFDVACLAGGPDLTSLAVTFLADIPCIVAPRIINGESRLNDIWYRVASRFVITTPHSIGQYAPREYLRLLGPLDILSNNTKKKLAYSPQAEEKAHEFLESYLKDGSEIVIGISPSAGNKIKNWGGKKFAELARRLLDEYPVKIFVIGGLRDREEVKEMFLHVTQNARIINASEKFSVDELKAFISELNLFVAVDTGPIYIAEAFGVPTVDIVGPMDEREQPPRGERHLVVIPPGRREPALHLMNAHWYDRNEARFQTDSITVDMVFDACKKLIHAHHS